MAPATIPSHLIAFKASRGRADDHSMGAVGYAWRVANDYLEMVRKSSGYPEDPVPDVGQGAHWMSEQAPRAWEQIKAGGSAFRRSIAEGERERGSRRDPLTGPQRDQRGADRLATRPEIMAALAVLGVYEQQLMAGLAAFRMGKPGLGALVKLARRRGLDDREWAHLHDVLDAFSAPA